MSRRLSLRRTVVIVACLAPIVPGASLIRAAGPQARDTTRAPTATGTGVVAGRVVTVTAGEPVHRAIVTIAGPSLTVARSIVTDDAGHFSFDALPAGSFTITASKPAYLPTAFGSKRPGRPGTPIAVAAGQRVADITILLARGAVLAGTVRAPTGEPLPGVEVLALRSGEPPPRPMTVMQSPPDGSTSDDRGAFRIYGLPPGDYTVVALPRAPSGLGELHERSSAELDAILRDMSRRIPQPAVSSPAPAAIFGLAPIYFPGTPVASDATIVHLAQGQARDDLDFQVGAVPSASIDGAVVRPATSEGAGVTLVISGAGRPVPLSLALAPRLVMSPGPDGKFRYVNVTPGRYTVTALASSGSLWASATVDVGGSDIAGVMLTLQPALTISGRVVFDAASLTPPKDMAAFQLLLETLPGLDGSAMSNNTPYGPVQRTVFARVKANGTFEMSGVVPGPYRVNARGVPTGPSGWWLRSAVIGGVDALDEPFEVAGGQDLGGAVVTFSDRHTELSGALQTPGAQPTSDFFIVVFPASSRLRGATRRVRSIRPGTDGGFAFADLPPGEYILSALADLEPDDLRSTTFLEEISGSGVRVTLGEGEKKRQDLRIRVP